MKTKLILKALAALLLLASPVAAAPCAETEFEGVTFTLCEVRAGEDLRLFHSDPAGDLLGSFGAVNDLLSTEGKTLAFAMNAGMYHPDRRPVGLYIERGQQLTPVITGASAGNFGMLPNGVFCIAEDGFRITDSRDFAANPRRCQYATQSGPLMVKQGQLHPRFIPGGDSRYIRNGVGVSADGTRAVFAISEASVNFDTFGRMYRDHLGMPDALYFDGKVSRLFSPALGRSDLGLPMGPIVGLAVPAH